MDSNIENRKRILVVGLDSKTLQGVVDMLNEIGYETRGESIDERALETFNKFDFDDVLLGDGVSPKSHEFLVLAFTKVNPKIKIVQAPW